MIKEIQSANYKLEKIIGFSWNHTGVMEFIDHIYFITAGYMVPDVFILPLWKAFI
jgi:hypothetical protein